MIWAWLIIAKVTALVEDVRPPEMVDEAFAGHEGAPLMVAEAVGQAAAANNLWWPLTDQELGSVLARDGRPVEPESAPAGAVVQLVDGRLGLVVGGGVIESFGEALCMVPPTPGRYVRGWLLPGVRYL